VAPKTQLDALIGILESREDWLSRTHTHAVQALSAARALEGLILERLAAERPAGPTADEWKASEQRVERLRVELKAQKERIRVCVVEEEAARAALEAAHRRVETMKKAAERIRAGILRTREKAESREHDELALLRFQHAS
jgi:flagellar biosynthesis chaperone FliJ